MAQDSATHGQMISLIICTLNEAESIAGVLAEVGARLSGASYEILVVDDSVDDATAAVVRRYAARDNRIRLIRRVGARGLASACTVGWAQARGDILGVFDGDGQHDPGMLLPLANRLLEADADVAIASRFLSGEGPGLSGFRRALSEIGIRLSACAIGARATDPLAGFFFMRRRWYEAIQPRLTGLGFKILIDVLASGKRPPKVVELPTALRARTGGGSKLDLRVMIELAAQLVEKRSLGLVSARFAMFASVGATGLALHMLLLTALVGAAAPFWVAQCSATACAMVSNYALNNIFTYRDLRHRGRAWWTGLASFGLACTSGALISQLVGLALSNLHAPSILAGGAGAVSGALWNYWSTSRVAWNLPASRRGKRASAPVYPVESPQIAR
jgi:dolichol-phosphate mannosyltransferase